MSWNIIFSKSANKALDKLNPQLSERIIDFLEERILIEKRHPKTFGEPLAGNLIGFWRYRVGDYRIICKIEDDTLIVLVLEINHRKQVYKKSKERNLQFPLQIKALSKPKGNV